MTKKILILYGFTLMFTGCATTSTIYEGSMTYPQNIMFDSANFKYVKTISGKSHAVYNGWGLDRQRVPEGLINTAKANMYKTHIFLPNQVITNISNDVVRTFSDKWSLVRYEVSVVMSADVYEFSNNGTYSSEDNKNNVSASITEKDDSLTADEEKSSFNDTNTIESVNPSNKENPDYIIVSGRKYSVGDEVTYTFGHKEAKIEKFILNKRLKYFYEIEIRFLKNNKIKLTTLEYIE
jgi:hypothetical protein